MFPGLSFFALYTCSDTSGFTEGDTITDILQLIAKESEEIEKVSNQLAEACIEPTLRKV